MYGADPGKYPSRYSILADSLRKLNVQSIVICLESSCRNAIGVICRKKIKLEDYLSTVEYNLISNINFLKSISNAIYIFQQSHYLFILTILFGLKNQIM